MASTRREGSPRDLPETSLLEPLQSHPPLPPPQTPAPRPSLMALDSSRCTIYVQPAPDYLSDWGHAGRATPHFRPFSHHVPSAMVPAGPRRLWCFTAPSSTELVLRHLGPIPQWQQPFFDDSRCNPLIQYAAPKQAASSDDQLPLCSHTLGPRNCPSFTTFNKLTTSRPPAQSDAWGPSHA